MRAMVIAVLPVIVCIAVYMLDDPTKHSLIFIPASFRMYQLYTTHFVHFTLPHLFNNLLAYFIFVCAAYAIFTRVGKGFWKTLAIILLVAPLVASLSWLLASRVYPFENVSMYGFSTISSAVIGLFGFGIFLHLITLNAEKNSASLFVLLSGVALIPITYGNLPAGLLLLVICIAAFAYSARSIDRIPKKDALLLVLGLILYQIGILSIFPSQIIRGSTVVNILAHYAGFAVGYFTPWLADDYQTRRTPQTC